MPADKSAKKGERALAARASATGKKANAPAGTGPVQLMRQDSDETIAKISRVLRKKRPDLEDDPSNPASGSYLASSLVAYAADRQPQSLNQWCTVLKEVLDDAGMALDDDDNDEATASVVNELFSRGILGVATPKIEVLALVLGLLTEDDDWHEAVVEEDLGDQRFRLLFLEYGKPQDTAASNIRLMDTVVDDDESDDQVQQGECEMCGRNLLLTFHHLIPKDTHANYVKKKLPAGINGEPTRNFLNTYGTMVCRQCHGYIHGLASNTVLAQDYNTLEKILAHPRVQRWVEWAGKQRTGK